MFSVSSISVSYPGKELLKNISFIINSRDRIGLVGKNGSGKTTILNIIAGLKSPDSGTVVIPENKTTGYLKQELKTGFELSVFDETMHAFDEVMLIEKEIEELNRKITTGKDYHSSEYMKSIEKLTQKYDHYNYLDGNKRLYNLGKVLTGLGFRESDFDRKVSDFSGGWQMRIELAKLLLKKPDLILLDEPTNHLDIESILWLEDFLINYPGAVIIVSHDKTFLENICTRTIEIVFGRIYDYSARYSEYLKIREERYESQLASAKNQEKFIQQQERFIRTFRAKSTKARQVKSRIKMLDKIERIEKDQFDSSSVNFYFPAAARSGKVVVEAADVSKSYEDKLILENINFTISSGERIAFVGRNGEGKTTMVRMITGDIDYSGSLKTGYNVTTGYYAQVQERNLDENNTVIRTLEDIAGEEWNNTKIRTLLGAFLFGEKDIDKKVRVLSGGEKSRLALARLLLRPANFLVLDEPTNHLDIPAKEVLKKALTHFKGTVILVSHDRDFLRGLTTRTFEFKDHHIREYIGGIDDFLAGHKVETFREFELIKNDAVKQRSIKDDASLSKGKYLQKKETDREFKKIKNALKKCEEKIEHTESKIKELEAMMQTPEIYADSLKAKRIGEEHKTLQLQLEKMLEEWEKAHGEFEDFKEKYS